MTTPTTSPTTSPTTPTATPTTATDESRTGDAVDQGTASPTPPDDPDAAPAGPGAARREPWWRGAGRRVRLGRPAVAGALAAVVTAVGVLLASEVRPDEYEARVSLLATPATPAAGATAQYGEVVSLTLPALVEVARSPSVLRAAAAHTGIPAGELGAQVAVELVPASGLARLSVRGPTAAQAGAAAIAIARTVIGADLLAPAGTLRLLDARPDVAQVAPDRPLGLGLALAAAVVAGVAAAGLRHVLRPGHGAVRAALAAAGVHHPVTTARADEPDLAERLDALCAATGRRARVVAVAPGVAAQATVLADRLASCHRGPTTGSAVVAVTRRGGQDELATVVGALPSGSVLVGVVLA